MLKGSFYSLALILLISLVMSEIVSVAICNPVPYPAIGMPYECIYARLFLVEDTLAANVTGTYTFINLGYENVTMLYPVPPGSTVNFVKIGNTTLDWQFTNEIYQTYLGNYTMIEWFIEPVPDTFNITVCYEHPLCFPIPGIHGAVPGTYGFLYAMGTGKLLTNWYKETTANISISINKNIVQENSLSLFTVKRIGSLWFVLPADFNLTSQDEEWMLTATFQSELFKPLEEDLLLTFIEGVPPEISDPIHEPAVNVQVSQTVNVMVNVSDIGVGVNNVTLWYTINNGTSWIPVPMNRTSLKTFQATIPGFDEGTHVSYKITAYDYAGNKAENNNNNNYYTYTIVPEYSFITILTILTLSTILIVAFNPKREP